MNTLQPAPTVFQLIGKPELEPFINITTSFIRKISRASDDWRNTMCGCIIRFVLEIKGGVITK